MYACDHHSLYGLMYAAHQIQGATGPGGSSALQWCDYLLWFVVCSTHLHQQISLLMCHMQKLLCLQSLFFMDTQ